MAAGYSAAVPTQLDTYWEQGGGCKVAVSLGAYTCAVLDSINTHLDQANIHSLQKTDQKLHPA